MGGAAGLGLGLDGGCGTAVQGWCRDGASSATVPGLGEGDATAGGLSLQLGFAYFPPSPPQSLILGRKMLVWVRWRS